MKRPTPEPKVGSTAWQTLECLREHGPMTYEDIVEETGIHAKTVRSVLSTQHGTRCRITRWRRGSDFYDSAMAVWAYGPGPDAAKPPRYTPTERDRRYRQRQRTAVNSVWALGSRMRDRHMEGIR
jgi:hypothetical protein